MLDRLNEIGLPVKGPTAGKPPQTPKPLSTRAASHRFLREQFEHGAIDLDPNDEELAAQLCAIKWDVDSRGRVRAERKEDMRRRGLPSPDRADAVAMAMVQHEAVVDIAAHTRGATLAGDILGMQW